MNETQPILVTGGAGFIGCNFVREWLNNRGTPVINLDKLTYAGSEHNLTEVADDSRHQFVHGDIGNAGLITNLLESYRPRAIVNLAAESHVDRSISSPEVFIESNVVGTFRLLESARRYWETLPPEHRDGFRFLHVSTDEVFGSLEADEPAFTESNRYQPRSPYAASKASADHLVMAFHHTYGLPVLLTNCSNNYGPYQHPEKLIPLMITRAQAGETLPVYGDGQNRRDWLFVSDHCAALRRVLDRGKPGRSYNIGGHAETSNLDIVTTLCDILDRAQPLPGNQPRRNLVTLVADRPGHDRRYAMDTGRVAAELDWRPATLLADGLARTVAWYLENGDWLRRVSTASHSDWMQQHYARR